MAKSQEQIKSFDECSKMSDCPSLGFAGVPNDRRAVASSTIEPVVAETANGNMWNLDFNPTFTDRHSRTEWFGVLSIC